ncbi:GGDEF domain-containing protein [Mesorhizobium koreense]|jgi:diguanylate cyclase (GGDEF)-like protein|uniref:GGDEF domain-containing protein n=1 Tax=Mesorhizobium koreense TaxID=3074855 RepID=UPI00287BA06B|nr:GGDEF domain-containing protein [Mesorhizobium sp. WR6]
MQFLGSEVDPATLEIFFAALGGTHVGICLCDADDQVQFVNDKFRSTFFPSAPPMPFDFVDAIAADIASGKGIKLESMPLDVFVPRVRARRKNGDDRYNFALDMMDGSWWWVNDYRMPNGWILVIASDISQSKNEEVRLRAAHDAAVKETQVDALTGVASRKYGLQHAQTILTEHGLAHLPVCFAILDIDHFKRINDTYGHLVGDEVLVHFSRHLSDKLGDGDFVTRLGGEEFLVVLPNAAEERAVLRLQRALLTLEPLPSTKSHAPLTFTFSGGVTLALQQETLPEIFRRADDALYVAKQNGRARIEVADRSAFNAA